MLDEADSSSLHRFMSMARLLMSFHPRAGAERYAIALGQPTRLQVGWNECRHENGNPTRYILISVRGGVTTLERPDVPAAEIHVVTNDGLPILESSDAWRQLQGLASDVRNEGSGSIEGDWVQQVVDRIAEAGRAPTGADPSVDAAIERHLSELEAGLRNPPFHLSIFADPVSGVLADYLDFRLTLPHASNILAALLFQFAIKIPSTGGEHGLSCALDEIDHLTALMGAAGDRRWQCDIGSFYRLGYLAGLYADTTVVMCNGLRQKVPPEHPAVGRLAARAKYADEFFASVVGPTLNQPQEMFPFGLAETLAMFASPASREAPRYAAPARSWEEVVVYSRARREHFDWTDDLGADVLCESVQKRLKRFLLSYAMGFGQQ